MWGGRDGIGIGFVDDEEFNGSCDGRCVPPAMNPKCQLKGTVSYRRQAY